MRRMVLGIALLVAPSSLAQESGIALALAHQARLSDPETHGDIRHRALIAGDDRRVAEMLTWSFPAGTYTIALRQKARPDGSSVAELFEPARDVLAVNGGFFARRDDGSIYPVGLLVADGSVARGRNAQGHSGAVTVDLAGRLAIGWARETGAPAEYRDALQSGPLLVEPDGKPGISRDDGVWRHRTALCQTRDGRLLVAYVGAAGMSLHELAEYLRMPAEQGGGGCRVALNLDGGPSSQVEYAGPEGRLSRGGSRVNDALVIRRVENGDGSPPDRTGSP